MGYVEVRDRKPTERAEFFLNLAANKAISAAIDHKGLSPEELADVLHKLASGMIEIAIGLRATYLLLEKK